MANLIASSPLAPAEAAAIAFISTTTVDPYPVTVIPVPIKFISVNPKPTLPVIIPLFGVIVPTPAPTPDVNNSPSL